MVKEPELRRRLKAYGQEHLLSFWVSLDPGQREELAADIEQIDFARFTAVWKSLTQETAPPSAAEMSVPQAFPAQPTVEFEPTYARGRELGEQLLRDNRVGAMVVAGGQGTRLGFDGPKGAYPIGPVSGKCLFQLFAESILATNRRYQCRVPWYVMTSTTNHEATMAFFESAEYFGLAAEDVVFFKQGMMPAADASGKILLAEKHRVALAPNGHGGSLTALAENGILETMAARGVDYVSYFQVDNPLVAPVDPLFLGLHAIERSEVSSLTIGKASDDEKVGLFVNVSQKPSVVEYTSFPPALTGLRNPDGSRKFDLANIAVHVFNRAFIERLVGGGDGLSLPWHVARKQVPHIDTGTGERVTPSEPDALKAEMFVFDALPLAERSLLLHTARSERFSPVKNLEGVDSAATAKRDLVRRAAAWLESCGVSVPRTKGGEPDCVIEISPLLALDAEMLRERRPAILQIRRGDSVLLD